MNNNKSMKSSKTSQKQAQGANQDLVAAVLLLYNPFSFTNFMGDKPLSQGAINFASSFSMSIIV